MHPVILKGLVVMIHTIYTINLAETGTAVINCPNIAFLDDSARLTCSTSVNFTNSIYNCPCGFEQHCPQSGCTPLPDYNASIVNRTQTELTILSAQPQHGGNWSCSDGEGEGHSFCNLVLTRIPSVTITSDVDADSVNLGDRISLTVDIGGYYCSVAYTLTLFVGSVNYTLGSGGNNTNRNLTKTISFNVTQTHLGDVKRVFACDNHQWNITPEVVYKLQPNITTVPTTTCNGDVTSRSTETPNTRLVLYIAPAVACLILLVIIIIVISFYFYRRRNSELRQTTNCEPPYICVPGPANTAYFEIDAHFQLSGSNHVTGTPQAGLRRDVTLGAAERVREATGADDRSDSAGENNTRAEVVAQFVPDVEELYACVNKTPGKAVRNSDTAL